MWKNKKYTIGIVMLLVLTSLQGFAQIGGNTSPMQYSTHTYRVEMGDPLDLTLWQIYSGNLSDTDVESGSFTPLSRLPGGDYKVNRDEITEGDAILEVEFNGSMDPGNYTIAFKETNSDACFKTIVLPIVMQGPFDVDVALANPAADAARCPDSSNVLQTTTDYLTTIPYNVTLENPVPADTYEGANWLFRFTVTATGQGGGTSSTIDSVQVDYNNDGVDETLIPTGSVSTYSSVVTVDNDPAVSTVVLYVTFRDALGVTQDITMELSEIEGSYLETDTDPSETEDNIIYTMPNVGNITALN